jgi:hypothetical protein
MHHPDETFCPKGHGSILTKKTRLDVLIICHFPPRQAIPSKSDGNTSKNTFEVHLVSNQSKWLWVSVVRWRFCCGTLLPAETELAVPRDTIHT